MSGEPLKPFSPPAGLLEHLNGFTSIGVLVEWTLYLVFAFWALYTIVALYHWLKYSHASWVAFPAIALHILISFSLMAYALTGTLPKV